MSSNITSPAVAAGLSPTLTAAFAVAVGVVVFPLFAAQPLVGPIGEAFGVGAAVAGLAATVTLLGYAAGLMLVTPLTDVAESRRLILATLAVDVLALEAAAVAPTLVLLLAAVFVVGVATSAIQMLVPAAAAMTPEHERGRTIGTIMIGLMIGILLSRPIASVIASLIGWRASFAADGAAIALVGVMLARALPERRPAVAAPYVALIRSLGGLLGEEPILRRRAAYQALCMGAFGSFWTMVAVRLAEPPFGLSQIGVAAFAFAGAGGAIVSPIAGWAGDCGLDRQATLLAHCAVVAGLVLAGVAGAGWLGFDVERRPDVALGLLALAAIVLDLGVIADQTLGRRAVNMIRPEARGRINGLFTGLFFLGSALGSALSGLAWSNGGWSLVCALGLGFAALALLAAATERRLASVAERARIRDRADPDRHSQG